MAKKSEFLHKRIHSRSFALVSRVSSEENRMKKEKKNNKNNKKY